LKGEEREMDKVFKIGLLVLGTVFLGVYIYHADIERYEYLSSKKIVFDTKTGTTYQYRKADNRIHIINYLKGEIRNKNTSIHLIEDLGLSKGN
jgi:hypothetical protein